MKNKITIEICCAGVEDAVTAYEAGADRIELCSMIEIGGLTPSFGEFLLAKSLVDIPIVCLLRPRGGGFCYTQNEYLTMLSDGQLFAEAGAQGVAFGFLTEDGHIDLERTRMTAENLPGVTAVFHKAFDSSVESAEILPALKEAGVERLLTAGKMPKALLGAREIGQYILSGCGLQIMAAGGVRKDNVGEVISLSGVRQVHLALNKIQRDLSASHNSSLVGVFEQSHTALDKDLLKEFIREVRLIAEA